MVNWLYFRFDDDKKIKYMYGDNPKLLFPLGYTYLTVATK